MYYYLERFKQSVSAAVSNHLGVDEKMVTVNDADEKFDADIAVPCFAFAKELGQSPQEIAVRLKDNLHLDEAQSFEAVAGYLNIKLSSDKLARGLSEDLTEIDCYGASTEGQGKTAVVDFVGLNLSKPFSVGHLRPTVQGWALKKLLEMQSYHVISDSHLGDWGTPFGMWVVAYKKWGNQKKLDQDGAYELGRLYVKFRQAAKEDESLITEAKKWLKKLEEGDQEAVDFKQRFSQISLSHMHEMLKRLDVHPDENLGESFYIENAQELVNSLVERGVATEQADGSVIVDLSDKDIDTPILLRKSDGSALYATSDLETIRYRLSRWQPAKIIYSVGAEQQFHFKQVFALADKLGYSNHTELTHAWFGTVDEIDADSGKRGKMSSRKSTALLENLLDKAQDKAREIVKTDMSDEDIAAIAVGAIKFNDFAQPRRTNILFDWDKMFAFNGYSSVYIQYAATRIKSILDKIDIELPLYIEDLDYDWQAEHELLLQLSKYPAAIKQAANEYEPYYVAQYLYDLARVWNKYYENTKVLESERKILIARGWLINALRDNFKCGLGVLGIELPSKM